jgi:Ribonuclease G/E
VGCTKKIILLKEESLFFFTSDKEGSVIVRVMMDLAEAATTHSKVEGRGEERRASRFTAVGIRTKSREGL